MAEQTTVKLTESKLELNGVQVTLRIQIGDWVKSVAISPINYDIFKKWHTIYAPRVIESIVKDIEYSLEKNNDGKRSN